MTQYYFLGTSLPPLALGDSCEMSFGELMHLFYDNLSKKDLHDVEVIRRLWDMENIRHYWKKEPLEPYGNLDENQETESLLTQVGLPDYVYAFAEEHTTPEERFRRFQALFTAYFREEKKRAEGFVRDFLDFEWGLRLCLASFRAKRLGRDIVEELQDEDPKERLVMQILAQKDAPEWIAPEGYEDLNGVLTRYAEEPFELFQALCQYRYDHYLALAGEDIFSIRRLLSYMVRLILVEKWINLDKRKGQERMVKQLSEETS